MTDIRTEGWISKLPAPLRPYAILTRIDRPVGIWLLLLPGWWSITLASGGLVNMTAQDWKIMILFGIGAVLMRAAGCVINDLWDRDLDKKVERTKTRPLAAGTINTKQAVLFLALLLIPSLFILLQFNLLTILLGFAAMPLILTYPLMKRMTWWPQAFLGLTFNFGALMGWTAIEGTLNLPAILLYISGIFWTLGYDTIYAHQDREDDLLAGIKSTALKFGSKSKIWVGVFYALSFLFLLSAIWLVTKNPANLGIAFIPALHLSGQLRTWNPNNPESALKIFKSSRDYGLLVLLILSLT